MARLKSSHAPRSHPMSSAIPLRDADLDAFVLNWKTLLTIAPATYGMVAGDATAISGSYTTFHAALLLVQNPATKTSVTVLAKDIARASMLVLLRAQYRIIKANPAVTDANKTALGVRVSDPVPTPIPPPATFPVFNVINAAPLEQELTIHDSATPTARRKPAGVVGCLVYRSVGVAAATDPVQLDFMGMFTRSNFAGDTFAAGDAGKIASYACRWTNAKGQEGPWSAIVTKVVGN